MDADTLLEYLAQADTETEFEKHQKPRPHRTNRKDHGKCKVFAEFHWKYPKRGYHGGRSLEIPYDNILISDWGQETQISNEDTGNMVLDPSAFDTKTDNKKTIHVVDENEDAVGTWVFD